MDERFQALAERISELAGRWQHFAFWGLVLLLWIGGGAPLGWSDTWQLIANTPTTWYELFLGLLILAAANRVQRRQDKTLQHIQDLLDAVKGEVDEELADLGAMGKGRPGGPAE